MLVSQILKSKADDSVVTALPSITIAQAAQILAERRIGTLIITRDERTLDGIVSERDIVRQLGREGAACMAEPVSSGLISLGDVVKARLMELAMEKDALEGMIRGH